MVSLGTHEAREDSRMKIRGVDLIDLCNQYGTPLYVFDEKRLRDNLLEFRQAFERHYSKVIVCYSTKTNYNLAICDLMHQVGAYAEVCSHLDLQVALKVGFDPAQIILDGPYKPDGLIREALEKRILLINVESLTELRRLNKIAEELGMSQPIGIRVNLSKPRSLSREAISCNLSSRFGFHIDEAYSVFREAAGMKRLQVKGMLTHPYHDAAEQLLPLAKRLYDELGIEIEYINLGGGFDPGTTRNIGSRAMLKDFIKEKIGFKSNLDGPVSRVNMEAVGKAITDQFKQFSGKIPEPTIVLEPGRFVVDEACLLLLRVDHVKEAGGFKWAFVDGGTNILPISSERHEVRLANRMDEQPSELVNIVGPIPSPIDLICLKKWLPHVREGDIIAVFDCGAYSLSSSNQFLYPRPSVVMLTLDRGPVVIREAETFEYVTQLDRILD